MDKEQEGGETEGGKVDSSLDKPARGLTERGSQVVAEHITRLLEKAGLDAEDLGEQDQTRKVSFEPSARQCRAIIDTVGQNHRRSVDLVPPQRLVDLLLLCGPCAIPGRAAS